MKKPKAAKKEDGESEEEKPKPTPKKKAVSLGPVELSCVVSLIPSTDSQLLLKQVKDKAPPKKAAAKKAAPKKKAKKESDEDDDDEEEAVSSEEDVSRPHAELRVWIVTHHVLLCQVKPKKVDPKNPLASPDLTFSLLSRGVPSARLRTRARTRYAPF